MMRVAIGVAICVLNAVAGWTVIGWMVCLVAFALVH
jgi:Superinfection immunity protein